MKNYIFSLIFFFAFSFGSVCMVWSGDFKSAMKAYEKGDYTYAVKELKLLAKTGHSMAQHFLGEMFYKGKGVNQDYKSAVKWYTLSAEQGNEISQYNLGIMYSFGLGVVPDYLKALKWYMLSSEQGYALAQYNLGRLYYLGNGVKEDLVYAHMWFDLATLNGFEEAAQLRKLLVEQMTVSQINDTLKLTRECIRKRYKAC